MTNWQRGVVAGWLAQASIMLPVAAALAIAERPWWWVYFTIPVTVPLGTYIAHKVECSS